MKANSHFWRKIGLFTLAYGAECHTGFAQTEIEARNERLATLEVLRGAKELGGLSNKPISSDQALIPDDLRNVKFSINDRPAVVILDGNAQAGSITSDRNLISFITKTGKALEVGKSKILDAVPHGFPLRINAVLEPDGTKLNVQEVEGLSQQLWARTWEDLTKKGLHDVEWMNKVEETTKSYKLKLDDYLQNAKKGNAKNKDRDLTILQGLSNARLNDLGNAYSAASNNETKLRLSTVMAAAEIEDKALSGEHIDNYPPDVYLRISRCTAACGALQFGADDEPRLSACIIGVGEGPIAQPKGPDIVMKWGVLLTCRHEVSAAWDRKDEIYFIPDREHRGKSTRDGTKVPLIERITQGEPREDDLAPLDYALFKFDWKSFESSEEERKKDSETLGLPFEPVHLLHLADSMPAWQSPLVVVGHPKGKEKLVHDNAWLLFPHVVDSAVEGRMMGAFSESVKSIIYELKSEREKGWEKFWSNAYSKANGGPKEYLPLNEKTDLRETVFGLDSDTFGGDSGAPVIGRRDGLVVGVFKGGIKTPEEEGVPTMDYFSAKGIAGSYDHHEVAVPIDQIIKDLDDRMNGWAKNLGITIKAR